MSQFKISKLTSLETFQIEVDDTNKMIKALNGGNYYGSKRIGAEIVEYFKKIKGRDQRICIKTFLTLLKTKCKRKFSEVDIQDLQGIVLSYILRHYNFDAVEKTDIKEDIDQIQSQFESSELTLNFGLDEFSVAPYMFTRVAYSVDGLKVWFKKKAYVNNSDVEQFVHTFYEISCVSAENLADASIETVEDFCLKYVSSSKRRLKIFKEVDNKLEKAEQALFEEYSRNKGFIQANVIKKFISLLVRKSMYYSNEFVPFEMLVASCVKSGIDEFLNSEQFRELEYISDCIDSLRNRNSDRFRAIDLQELDINKLPTAVQSKTFRSFFRSGLLQSGYHGLPQQSKIFELCSRINDEKKMMTNGIDQTYQYLVNLADTSQKTGFKLVQCGNEIALLDTDNDLTMAQQLYSSIEELIELLFELIWEMYLTEILEQVPTAKIDQFYQFRHSLVYGFFKESSLQHPGLCRNFVQNVKNMAYNEQNLQLYTDASVKDNAYAIAVVEQCTEDSHKPLSVLTDSSKGSVSTNQAEIAAILMAMVIAVEKIETKPNGLIQIFSDCGYALNRVAQQLKLVNKDYTTVSRSIDVNKTLTKIRTMVKMPHGQFTQALNEIVNFFGNEFIARTHLTWVKGHANVEGNTAADKLANQYRKCIVA